MIFWMTLGFEGEGHDFVPRFLGWQNGVQLIAVVRGAGGM